MSHFQQHPKFFNKPIKLTEEEMKNPIRVIIDFFTDYNLSEVREINHNIDRVCLTSDAPPFDDSEERDNLLVFRESEEKVMEAAFMLMESQPDTSRFTHAEEGDDQADTANMDTMNLDDVQNKVRHLQTELSELHKSLMKTGHKGLTLMFHPK
jgi:hypothetical protein